MRASRTPPAFANGIRNRVVVTRDWRHKQRFARSAAEPKLAGQFVTSVNFSEKSRNAEHSAGNDDTAAPVNGRPVTGNQTGFFNGEHYCANCQWRANAYRYVRPLGEQRLLFGGTKRNHTFVVLVEREKPRRIVHRYMATRLTQLYARHSKLCEQGLPTLNAHPHLLNRHPHQSENARFGHRRSIRRKYAQPARAHVQLIA